MHAYILMLAIKCGEIISLFYILTFSEIMHWEVEQSTFVLIPNKKSKRNGYKTQTMHGLGKMWYALLFYCIINMHFSSVINLFYSVYYQ